MVTRARQLIVNEDSIHGVWKEVILPEEGCSAFASRNSQRISLVVSPSSISWVKTVPYHRRGEAWCTDEKGLAKLGLSKCYDNTAPQYHAFEMLTEFLETGEK
jgi:hypothetical protein